MVWDDLYGALASWYASVIPVGVGRGCAYESSRIPMRYFEALPPPPRGWEFWAERGCAGEGREYVGAVHDSQTFGERPVWDVVNWDPGLAMLGVLPPSFGKFLRINGHTHASCGPAAREVSGILRGQLKQMWVEYMALKAGRSGRVGVFSWPGGVEPPPRAAGGP